MQDKMYLEDMIPQLYTALTDVCAGGCRPDPQLHLPFRRRCLAAYPLGCGQALSVMVLCRKRVWPTYGKMFAKF